MAEKQSNIQSKKKRNPADHLKEKRFQPGQSGNPAGRPKKGSAIADILNAIGNRKYGKDITYREQMLLKAYKMAIDGDSAARAFIAERTEGKVIERFADVTEQITKDDLDKKLAAEKLRK